MKSACFATILSLSALVWTGPAHASQTPVPELAVGMVVYDPQNGEAGRIESVSGENVVLDTGTSKATLPKNAFGAGKQGPTITMTKAQINAAVANSLAKSKAALEAALVPGVEVRGAAGAVVGTIKQVDGDQVVLDRPAGAVSLSKATFATTGGAVTLALTSAELDAAAKAASEKASAN